MDKLSQAIKFAVDHHQGQIRKFTNGPYILHPLEAMMIASTITNDEDTLCAVVLHDTVEDTDATIEDIELNFGKRIKDLVSHETENKYVGIAPENTWRLRKEETLSALKNTQDISVKIMWLADKLSNIRSIYKEYQKRGEDIWNSFHQKDKSQHAWYYKSVAENISELKDTDAYKEFLSILEKTF